MNTHIVGVIIAIFLSLACILGLSAYCIPFTSLN